MIPVGIVGRYLQITVLGRGGKEDDLHAFRLIGLQFDRGRRGSFKPFGRNDVQRVGAGRQIGDVDLPGLIVRISLGLIADRNRCASLIERGAGVGNRCSRLVAHGNDQLTAGAGVLGSFCSCGRLAAAVWLTIGNSMVSSSGTTTVVSGASSRPSAVAV